MLMAGWGYAVGSVSVAASIVTAIAFGIVVDDTIHLMTKYLRVRSEGSSPAQAIVPTFKLVGRPLLTTTLVFALGFLVFGASGLAVNQTLGLLVSMTVVIALVADFFCFLPCSLRLTRKWPMRRSRNSGCHENNSCDGWILLNQELIGALLFRTSSIDYC